jgi:hypothetical protein
MNHNCYKCGRNFKKKHHLEYHLNKKNSCDGELHKENINDKNNDNITNNSDKNDKNQIDAKKLREYLDECKCVYCDKKFTRKNSVLYHIKNNCKKVREIENKKQQIFLKLKEEENNRINKLEEENKKLKEAMEKKDNDFSKEIMELKKSIQELKTGSITTKNINSHNKTKTNMNINSNNTDNSINTNYNNQNIVLNNYNKEDLSILDDDTILAIMKRGYQSTVELTRAIHFNPEFPENHNIFIPKINERHGMVYQNNSWKLIDKDELADDIFENKKDLIVQNLDKFFEKLNQFKKNSLMRFLDNDDNDDEAIINTKNQIKELLYNNRKMAMERKKVIEKANKNKPLEIIKLKKPIPKLKSQAKKNYSDYDSDSSYVSNYSYIHSLEKDKEK